MTTNPWLSHAASEPAAAPEVVQRVRERRGPSALGPQQGVPAPDMVDQLPFREQPAPAALWWLGVHGGAGESTLARLVPGARAAGHAWPRPPITAPVPIRLVLVSRSHASGLRAAQKAATHWAAGGVGDVELLGLVVVADAPGRLPRPLRDLAALVAGGVPRTWHVPWVDDWRLGHDVTPQTARREVRRLIADLTELIPDSGPAIGGTH